MKCTYIGTAAETTYKGVAFKNGVPVEIDDDMASEFEGNRFFHLGDKPPVPSVSGDGDFDVMAVNVDVHDVIEKKDAADIRIVSAENATLKSTLEEANDQIELLEAESLARKKQNDNSAEVIGKLQTSLRDARTDLHPLQSKLQQSAEQIEIMSNKGKNLREENDALRKEVADLKTSNEGFSREVDKLAKQVGALNGDNDLLTVEVTSLRNLIDSAEAAPEDIKQDPEPTSEHEQLLIDAADIGLDVDKRWSDQTLKAKIEEKLNEDAS